MEYFAARNKRINNLEKIYEEKRTEIFNLQARQQQLMKSIEMLQGKLQLAPNEEKLLRAYRFELKEAGNKIQNETNKMVTLGWELDYLRNK